jgi:anti-sigma factor RsiW
VDSVGNLPCREVFARLDDYLDRTLGPEELAAVEHHLALCAVCTAEFRFETLWVEQLRDKLRRLQVPAELAGRLASAASGERLAINSPDFPRRNQGVFRER